MAVVASMAEMASICPTSGGQYHWVSEFAPPSAQRFLSYITGILVLCNSWRQVLIERQDGSVFWDGRQASRVRISAL